MFHCTTLTVSLSCVWLLFILLLATFSRVPHTIACKCKYVVASSSSSLHLLELQISPDDRWICYECVVCKNFTFACADISGPSDKTDENRWKWLRLYVCSTATTTSPWHRSQLNIRSQFIRSLTLVLVRPIRRSPHYVTLFVCDALRIVYTWRHIERDPIPHTDTIRTAYNAKAYMYRIILSCTYYGPSHTICYRTFRRRERWERQSHTNTYTTCNTLNLNW